MYASTQSSLPPVFPHDLLNPTRRILVESPALKEVFVPGMRLKVGRQNQTQGSREQNLSILGSFALLDPSRGVVEVQMSHLNVTKLIDPNGCREQEPHHDLVVHILDDT